MEKGNIALYALVALVAALVAGAGAYTQADSSETVQDLETEISDYEDQVDNLQTQVSDLQNDLEEAKNERDNHKDQVDNLQDQLDSVPVYNSVVEASHSETITVYKDADHDYESEFSVNYNVGTEDNPYRAEYEFEYDAAKEAVNYNNIEVRFYEQEDVSIGERSPVDTAEISASNVEDGVVTFEQALEEGSYDVVVDHDFDTSEIEDDEDIAVEAANVEFDFGTTEDLYVKAD